MADDSSAGGTGDNNLTSFTGVINTLGGVAANVVKAFNPAPVVKAAPAPAPVIQMTPPQPAAAGLTFTPAEKQLFLYGGLGAGGLITLAIVASMLRK